MTPRLEALAASGAALSQLAKDYPDVPELKVGLSLVIEELKKEARSRRSRR